MISNAEADLTEISMCKALTVDFGCSTDHYSGEHDRLLIATRHAGRNGARSASRPSPSDSCLRHARICLETHQQGNSKTLEKPSTEQSGA